MRICLVFRLFNTPEYSDAGENQFSAANSFFQWVFLSFYLLLFLSFSLTSWSCTPYVPYTIPHTVHNLHRSCRAEQPICISGVVKIRRVQGTALVTPLCLKKSPFSQRLIYVDELVLDWSNSSDLVPRTRPIISEFQAWGPVKSILRLGALKTCLANRN